MWQGKNKALTFSFDDGVVQDRRVIEIFNRYGLKGTFNLNSAFLGMKGKLVRNGKTADYTKVEPDELPETYRGHEIAVHTLTHPRLYGIPDDTLVYQVEEDRLALSKLAGYEVVGMAYPFGDCNEHIAEVIRNRTGVKYSRTVKSTKGFAMPSNPWLLDPTVYYIHTEDMFRLGREFLELKTEEPALFYVWGHAYELDADYLSWETFEEFCALVSGRDDIFYGTNKDILL